MKQSDISKLGLLPKTLEEQGLDHVPLIVRDEFNRFNGSVGEADYRARAVDRFIRERLPFYAEGNIAYCAVSRFVALSCPYCGNPMEPVGGSASGGQDTVRYWCRGCGATASLTIVNHGLEFGRPPKKKLEVEP